MKRKSIIGVIIFTLLIFSTSFICITKNPDEISESERRPLKQFPEFNISTLFSGDFMTEFMEYSTDQMPYRDYLRSIKAVFSKYILGKTDNNGLFTYNDHISKIEYPQNEEMIDHAVFKFENIYNKYMKDKNNKIYLSVIPDKNMFMKDKVPTINYENFINKIKNKTPYMKYIDVTDLLSLDDFYKTDSHWMQKKIVDVAEKIVTDMGNTYIGNFKEKVATDDFFGVYKGQSALPHKGDKMTYLLSEGIENSKVLYYDTGKAKEGKIYNTDKLKGKDPYEMFLSGSTPLCEIINEKSVSDKELIVFRDSYGSSLIPLMVDSYRKITVIDIRYIKSDFIGNFVEFENQDVLFIYSTTLLNNSLSLQ